VRAFWNAWEAADRERLRSVCTEDCRLHLTGGETVHVEEWVANLGELRQESAFGDFRIEMEDVVVADGTVVVRGRQCQTQQERFVGIEPGGRPVSMPFCTVFAVEGGLVAELWSVMDESQFLRQVGVLPGDGLGWKIRQQHRDVLTRVLRHNLRNDLNAALLYTQLVDDEELARKIRRPIEKLLAVGEKTRRVEQRVVEADLNPTAVDLERLVRSVVAEQRSASPGSELTAHVEDAAEELRTDPDLLATVLLECVENAVVHSDRDAPRVAVTVDGDAPGPHAVTIEVVDDGPGVPGHERVPLEQGGETAFTHASGVGLWAVKWGVERLGGDLSFDEREPRGSVVRLHLPDLE